MAGCEIITLGNYRLDQDFLRPAGQYSHLGALTLTDIQGPARQFRNNVSVEEARDQDGQRSELLYLQPEDNCP